MAKGRKSREAQFEERMTEIRDSIARAFDPSTPSHLVSAMLPGQHVLEKLTRIAGRPVSMEEVFQSAGHSVADVETLKTNAHLTEAGKALEQLRASLTPLDMHAYYYTEMKEHLEAVYPDNWKEGLEALGSSLEEIRGIADEINSKYRETRFIDAVQMDFPAVTASAPLPSRGPA